MKNTMLGQRTLLVNPPLINGVAFTRQGRCQEREDVLGTTKPPYTLALVASLLRQAGHQADAGPLPLRQVVEDDVRALVALHVVLVQRAEEDRKSVV